MFDPLALLRGVASLGAAVVVGSALLLWLLRKDLTSQGGARWRRRVVLLLVDAAASGLAASALFTIGTAAAAADASPFSFDASVLYVFLTKTWAGGVTLVQLAFALAAGVLCGLAWFTLEKRPASDLFALLAAGAAGLGLAAVAFASHPTSIEPEALGIAAAISHRLAMSLWLGGLPALLLLIGLGPLAEDARRLAALVLRRFSVLATAAMLVIVVSGTVLTWYLVGNFASAIGTAYGHLLIVKLLLLGGVLLIASGLQRRLLPALEMKPSDATILSYAKRVKIETVLAVLIVVTASGLAQQNPPEHEDIYWPLPFRFSIAATWGVPWVPTLVLAAPP